MRVATIVTGAILVFGSALAGDRPQNETTSSIADQLLGSWRLVSRVTTAADGRILNDSGLSAMPIGVLIYDRSGHVAGQVSRPGRTVERLSGECDALERVKEAENNSQAILGYDAYFGTYTVDAKGGVVTHHLEIALFPGDVGKDLKRNFSISGDTLTIKYRTTIADGTQVVRAIVWARMK
jgi:hypothetical protein